MQFDICISDDNFLATVDVDGATEIVVGKAGYATVDSGDTMGHATFGVDLIDGDRWYVSRVSLRRLTRWLIEMRNRGCVLDDGPPPLERWWLDGVNDFAPAELKLWIQEARIARQTDS